MSRANGGQQAANGGGGGDDDDEADSFRRVAYFRMGPKRTESDCQLNEVDASLCTHIILDSARISSSGCLIVSCNDDYVHLNQVGHFKATHNNNNMNRNGLRRVRVLISVSNGDHSNGFPLLAASSELRQTFARSAIEFLERYHLDGLDLNWKYPYFGANFLQLARQRDQERTGLTKIVKSLRSAMVESFYARQLAEQHQLAAYGGSPAIETTRAKSSTTTVRNPSQMNGAGLPAAQVEQHLLTVAIAGQESVLRVSYELRQLANLCDWLNVMSYDYFLFKAYAPFTGPNAPLHPVVDNYVPILGKLALSWTVARLLEEGLEPRKLVLGIPTFARAYRLLFRSSGPPGPFALSAGPGRGGQQQQQSAQTDAGHCLSYGQVLELLARDDSRAEFDERARVPYLLADGGYTWITYENPQSVREKVHYILERRLGGYMTWTLDSDHSLAADDHQKTQNGGSTPQDSGMDKATSFPLHRAMLDEVASYHCDSTKQQTRT